MKRYRDCDECGGIPNAHPTVHVQFGDLSACVDEHLAPFVEACWRSGVWTTSSCQDIDEETYGRPSHRASVFFDLHDYVRFAEQMLAGPHDALYESMTSPPRYGGWEWAAIPAEYDDGEVVWLCWVELPHSDLKAAVARLTTNSNEQTGS